MIDIGANLAAKSFADDIDDVLSRARQHHVEKVIVTGSCADSNEQALALTRRHKGFLFATAGLHPHHASTFNSDILQQVRIHAQLPEVVAIGETGLDFNRNFSPVDAQINAFKAHLNLAEEIDKPLFLHERDAFHDFSKLLKEHQSLCERAVVHCFTGSEEALTTYLELGCYIGITGWICDEKRGKRLREIIRHAPLDRLMIETDAPYLTPHKKLVSPKLTHKHRNEPWTLSYTATALAEALNTSVETVKAETANNAERFFRLN